MHPMGSEGLSRDVVWEVVLNMKGKDIVNIFYFCLFLKKG